ncbi:MATE family efflux transporter [Ammoniphilus sp. CFH 90114]|uniref:MATE family efflux transporter n=1 Tax=Ammoniphilus sp. CFH 90114 TaxID=2493665 RepID=UPI00100EEBF8|nr:MATE family efflux transporter [Ammoniphilus sp. CFH 90114]RXT03809.1 MATE family efflux transporter [Ammoniphilus sp. CFH 90114]
MNTVSTTSLSTTQPLTHGQFLKLSLPLILSGLSTPFLGAVDTAVVGQLPHPAYIGGVAIGALIFNYLYWVLGFLRVSTSGFTAQAQGAGDVQDLLMFLLRPLGIALLMGGLFIGLQVPIKYISLLLMESSPVVEAQAASYFDIRIWGAPFALANYVILGWLIGISKVKLALFLQIFMNLLNIGLDLYFVLVLQWGVPGVALATVISEVSAIVVGLLLLMASRKIDWSQWSWSHFWDSRSFLKMFKVNRDLFIRTLCLLTVFGAFTAYGSKLGEVTLAANAILMQLQFILAYFFGGFANASSILIGRSVGSKNQALFEATIRVTVLWSILASVLLVVGLLLAEGWIISLFTGIGEVKAVASEYVIWLLLFPFAVFWGLQFEGICSGATNARPVRNTMILSMLIFLVSTWLLVPIWDNHGLWCSFVLFSLSRSLISWTYLPKLRKSMMM